MTLAEKIIHLRTTNNISQEKLAAMLKVSRQSISKWESGESNPTIDKIVEIADLFKITLDELLKQEVTIHRGKQLKVSIGEDIKTKYFGTDGFRGEVNKVLTADHAYKIGRFLGWFYANPEFCNVMPGYRPKVVIGKDTRRSSYLLEYAVAAGLAASGADVYMLHVTTTPSVSYITRKDGFDCGVMITASHNPFYDNGIKVINASGEKLEDTVAFLCEAYIDHDFEKLGLASQDLPFAERENIGTINDYAIGRNRYVAYLISTAVHSFKGLRIGLDTANGASWMIAKSVFDALGAQTYVINNNPNGLNVNLDAGSTHIESFCNYVKENRLDLGFAFDGDADRCIAVDETGKPVDGDKIIYILGKKLKEEGKLNEDTVVTTIMSNSGLTKALKEIGVKNVQTKVGDRFVYEEMMKSGYYLGGEQSGHIIMRKYATTGDGVLTAIMVVEAVIDAKASLSKLAAPVKPLPQILRNVRVTNKAAVMDDEEVKAIFAKVNAKIGDNGRAILRQSGTEPVVRIMIELANEKECQEYIETIYNVIKKRGYLCE